MKKVAAAAAILFVLIIGGYHVLIWIDNDFTYGRMRETPSVRPHEEPLLLLESGIVPAAGSAEAIYRTTPGEEIRASFQATPEVIKQGETLYFTFCAQCHGKYHDGNGTVGQSFAPLPGDLRSAKIQGLPNGILFKEISYGIPKGRQPPLATTIAEADRWRIIAYVKSLGIRN